MNLFRWEIHSDTFFFPRIYEYFISIERRVFSSYHLDNIPQSPTIKEEKTEHHVNSQLRLSSNPPDTLDQPLLIVLDEEDSNLDDDFQSTNVKTPETKVQDDLSQDEGQKTLSSNRNLPTGIRLFWKMSFSPSFFFLLTREKCPPS